MQQEVILRRFKNDNGNWDTLEKLTKEINALAAKIEKQADALVADDNALRDLILKAYGEAPRTDCLFYDSPVSPAKQTFYLKMHFKKAGLDGVRDIFMDADKLQPFTKMVKDGCKWLLKFKDDSKVNKTV